MNVNDMCGMVNSLLRKAQQIVDSMAPQERKKLTDLAAEAGATVGMDADDALPHITWFAHNCDGIELSKGRTGGLYKGSKPEPTRKSRKKV